MKTRGLLKATLGAVCLAALFALPLQVSAITVLDITSAGYLGSITPDGGSPPEEAAYINRLVDLSEGDHPDLATAGWQIQDYIRSGNHQPGNLLPDAVSTDSYKNDSGYNIGSFGTGFEYLLGKYDNDKAGALVWYVGDLNGDFQLPQKFNNKDISHWVLYNSTDEDSPDPLIPDGGSTIALLGFALIGVDFLRRKISRA